MLMSADQSVYHVAYKQTVHQILQDKQIRVLGK